MSNLCGHLRVSFFTICASNYLSNAIALSRSLSAAHAGCKLTVYLLDELPSSCDALEHIDVVPAKTTMAESEWHHFQCFYTVLEVATGIKPLCFIHALSTGCDVAIYFDADIIVFKPLEHVLCAIRDGHDIVLTPHILTPLPADGKGPDDLAIMRAGIYNLGFAAFANTARSRQIIAWWARKLRTQALVDVAAGLFTDQKWIDFAPALSATTFIVRDPGYNVAYWNLHERRLSCAQNDWRVTFLDGSVGDLIFFHFSGYSPSIDRLSKHETRYLNRPPADVGKLLTYYSALLADAGDTGRAEVKIAPPHFKNGIAWDPICRLLYRDLIATDPAIGDPLCDPAFLKFAADVEPGDHIPRYVRAVLRLRPDVARVYDDGRNKNALIGWLRTDGLLQLDINPSLLDHLGIDVSLNGVNYIGYFRSHLGIGEAARNAVAALVAAGIEVTTRDLSHLAESPTGIYAIPNGAAHSRHPVTILGVNADQTPLVLNGVANDLDSTFLIGCWAWETPEFPEEWCDRFNLVDEVWVASNFVAEAVRAKATVPVFVIPYVLSVPEIRPDRAWLARICPAIEPSEFIFMNFFDVGSISFRKNPQGAIEAFRRAFKPDEPVRMIVKILNGQRDPDLLKSLNEAAAGYRVTIWDEALESSDRFRLLASTDALVSLHRSEGFGLVIAEAMAIGRPVIVTDWSGNTDFTNSNNAALVRYDLIQSRESHGPYAAGTRWAEPDLDHAARQMRRIWQDADWRSRITACGAKAIVERFSPEIVGALLKSRLQRLAASTRHYHRVENRPTVPEELPPSPPAIATAVPEEMPPSPPAIATALKMISRDALRRPWFYAVRAPRLPHLLATESFGDLLHRLVLHLRHQDIQARRDFWLRRLAVRVWSLVRGRVEQGSAE